MTCGPSEGNDFQLVKTEVKNSSQAVVTAKAIQKVFPAYIWTQ